MVAGPCSVENEKQTLETADAVKRIGAKLLRGGAFKPRTSPYSFRGLGEEGLRLLAQAGKATGMPVITEVMSVREVDVVAQYSDILQIGTRNAQNFMLLEMWKRLPPSRSQPRSIRTPIIAMRRKTPTPSP